MYQFNTVEEALEELKNGKIILVTDRQTSSLAAKADVVLGAKVEGMGFVNSYIAPMCISEIILLSVSSRCGDAGVERVRYLDDLMEQENLYWKGEYVKMESHRAVIYVAPFFWKKDCWFCTILKNIIYPIL